MQPGSYCLVNGRTEMGFWAGSSLPIVPLQGWEELSLSITNPSHLFSNWPAAQKGEGS
jgi:hypothetical protein